MPKPSRAPLSTCFGGGGAYGLGFNMGVADGLADAGVNIADGPMLGTSAGSITAAALATGVPFAEVVEVWRDRVSRSLRPGGWRAAELMEPLFGSSRPPVENVAAVAVAMRTFRRHVLSGMEYRLADITAASSTVVPVARPHRINGRPYMDGGFRSMASADLAEPAAQLLLITPFSHPRQGAAGRLGQRQAAREVKRWIEASGGSVFHVRPDETMARMSSNRLNNLGNIAFAERVYPLARDLGREVGERVRVDGLATTHQQRR